MVAHTFLGMGIDMLITVGGAFVLGILIGWMMMTGLEHRW